MGTTLEGLGCGPSELTVATVSTSVKWWIVQQEHSVSDHSTPQLSTRSGAESWKEAAQISEGSTATSVLEATTPQLPAPA